MFPEIVLFPLLSWLSFRRAGPSFSPAASVQQTFSM